MGWWISLIVASWLEASILVAIVIAAIGSQRRSRVEQMRRASDFPGAAR